jgi:hypothetical protein
MKNWRQILSWRNKDIEVGSTVKVIASNDMLMVIRVMFISSNVVGKVVVVDPQRKWGWPKASDKEYSGIVGVNFMDLHYEFPYSHWTEFLEIV